MGGQKDGAAPVRVFVSYAHEDRVWCDRLVAHLGALRHTGRLVVFDDRQIRAGEAWEARLHEERGAADIVVALISHFFINSKFCTVTELLGTLGRRTRIVPVLLDHVDIGGLPIAHLQIRPQDDNQDLKPLCDWPNANMALAAIAREIRELAERRGLGLDVLAADDAVLAARWRLLAVFPAGFLPDAAAAVWTTSEAEAEDALDALCGRSLLQADARTGRFQLHDRLRELALAEVDAAALEKARLQHAEHYRNVLARAHALFLAGHAGVLDGLALFDSERVNIQAAQSWAVDNAAQDDDAARLTYAIYDSGVAILNLRLPPRERIRWLEVALAGCRRVGDRRYEAPTLGNLGIAWAAVGEARKAIGFYEQQLAIAREIGDRPGEGNALANLGNAWASLAEPWKAIGFYEQRLAIAREIGDRRGEGATLGNLGLAWSDLGEARKAIGLYEQHLAIAREIGDRGAEGNALGHLGIAWAMLDEPQKGIEYFDQQLTLVRKIGDRLGEGHTLHNRGISLNALGRTAEAIASLGAAVVIYRQIGDPNLAKVEAWLREHGVRP